MFFGENEYMRLKIPDIIAIFGKAGHPDIFLTISYSPEMMEVAKDLLLQKSAQDRPHIMC